jgi:hypothetical protein
MDGFPIIKMALLVNTNPQLASEYGASDSRVGRESYTGDTGIPKFWVIAGPSWMMVSGRHPVPMELLWTFNAPNPVQHVTNRNSRPTHSLLVVGLLPKVASSLLSTRNAEAIIAVGKTWALISKTKVTKWVSFEPCTDVNNKVT